MGMPAEKIAWTIDQFLAWENEQTERHEFVGGEVFAMTGARDAHNTVALNVATALRAHLRGTPCRAFIADMKLHVERGGAVFYPDVMVVCQPRDFAPEADLAKRSPKLLIEVLSESTAAYDRGEKFRQYRTIAALEEYVLLDPSRPYGEVFRKDADGRWVLYPCEDGAPLDLRSVGLSLPVELVYEDVRFDDGRGAA